MADFQEIKSSLMELSRAELTEISKICSILMDRNTDMIPEASILYEVVVAGLNQQGLEAPHITFFRKQKPDRYKMLVDTSLTIDTWMMGINVKKRVDKRLFLMILTNLVIDALDKMNIPLSMSTIILLFKNSPAYFNNAFPGYVESGMIQFLLNSRRTSQE